MSKPAKVPHSRHFPISCMHEVRSNAAPCRLLVQNFWRGVNLDVPSCLQAAVLSVWDKKPLHHGQGGGRAAHRSRQR